jgi:hypothetical protein
MTMLLRSDSQGPASVTTSRLEAEAYALLQDANDEGLPLRLIGSMAVRALASEESLEFLRDRTYYDVDFVGLRHDAKKIIEFFEYRHFVLDKGSRLEDDFRLYLIDPKSDIPVDIFLDRLVACHTLDLRKRMLLIPRTIPPADLLLSKLQREGMRDVDFRDVVCLLASVPLGSHEHESIDVEYVNTTL